MRSWPVALAAVAVLAACSGASAGTASVRPGPSASDPRCGSLLGRLPQVVAGHRRSAAPGRGEAAWGPVLLRCGVTPLPPTPDACIGIDGIDWVFTETDRSYVFTTYGRSPAIEVSLPVSVARTQAPGQMTDLTAAVRPVRQSRHCSDTL